MIFTPKPWSDKIPNLLDIFVYVIDMHYFPYVENPVQMVWGSLVNINHYWDTKFLSYFTIIYHDIHQNNIKE